MEMWRPEPLDVPRFSFASYSYASDSASHSRLEIYLAIDFPSLKFLKTSQGFTATYEVQISFFDSTNALVFEKQWSNKVDAQQYEQTTSSNARSIQHQTFYLLPQKYHVTIQVRDLETRKPFRLQREITVPQFIPGVFSVSEVMFVEKIEMIEGVRRVVPKVSRALSSAVEQQELYCELYNPSQDSEAVFLLRALSSKNEEAYNDTIRRFISTGKNEIVLPLKNNRFAMGEYQLELNVYHSTFDEAPLANRKTSFQIYWEGLPTSVGDISEAIAQLVYIATSDELDSLQEKQLNPDERRERFMKFWKRRDISPSTQRNELMEEYYSRVSYANKQFGHHSPGWRTDRGMVYIIFGVPDNVERHPFEIDTKPFEIWFYYEQNRRFTFVDETGFGDYRLTTPIYEVMRREGR
ncbi:MAG: GWxTD domain-containing protein [Ignavibacteriales bacterium]|nr:GWxTD domain-containing protein [Ignavibacteriales bacterium]